MGTYFGHVDEALFFLCLALWWAYNALPAYIKALWHGDDFRTRMSYPTSGVRPIPVESILKLGFTLFGVISEMFFYGGPVFLDENNEFTHMNRLQHISIFGLFVVHSGIDLLMRLGAPLPRGMDRLSGALAFAWYGLCFDYHTRMEEKAGLERIVHILPTYLMEIISVSLVLETIRPSWFLAHLARIYATLCLGTWTIYTAHVLYLPKPFPGIQPNPLWDHSDMKNIHFVTAAFGYNLIFHLLFLTITYMMTLCLLKARGKHRPQFEQMTTIFKPVKKEDSSFLRSL